MQLIILKLKATCHPTKLHLLGILNPKTNGNQKTQILGNTQPDGSGDSHHIHVDANGNVRTSLISSVSVLPADNSNAELSPTKSFNVKDANITKGSTNVPNHCAMYVDDNKVLHIMDKHLSWISPYGNYYKQYTTGIYRWKNLSN